MGDGSHTHHGGAHTHGGGGGGGLGMLVLVLLAAAFIGPAAAAAAAALIHLLIIALAVGGGVVATGVAGVIVWRHRHPPALPAASRLRVTASQAPWQAVPAAEPARPVPTAQDQPAIAPAAPQIHLHLHDANAAAAVAHMLAGQNLTQPVHLTRDPAAIQPPEGPR